MKNIIIPAMLLTSLAMTEAAIAQTVDDIINKHIAAMGGKEKLMSLKTARLTGVNNNPQGQKVNIVLTQKYMTGLRTDRSLNGMKSYTIVTSKKGWILPPGETTPKPMPDEQYKTSVNRLDLQGTFINYKTKGTKIELAGKEKVNGSDCYNLKVTYKNGNITNYLIDSKTYLISKRINGEMYTIYTDYKKNAGGFLFAYTNNAKNGAVANFTKIETNIPVDDKVFEVDEGVF